MKKFSKFTEEIALLLESESEEEMDTPSEEEPEEDSEDDESEDEEGESEEETSDEDESEDESEEDEEEREPVEVSQEESDEINTLLDTLKEIADEESENVEELLDKVSDAISVLGMAFDKEDVLSKLESEEEVEVPLHDEEGEQTEVTVDSLEEEVNGETIGGDLVIRFTKDGKKIKPEVLAYFDEDEAVALEDIEFEISDEEDEEGSEDEEGEMDDEMPSSDDEMPSDDSDVVPDDEEEPTLKDGDIEVFESKDIVLKKVAKLNEEKYVAIFKTRNGDIRTTVLDLATDLIPLATLEDMAGEDAEGEDEMPPMDGEEPAAEPVDVEPSSPPMDADTELDTVPSSSEEGGEEVITLDAPEIEPEEEDEVEEGKYTFKEAVEIKEENDLLYVTIVHGLQKNLKDYIEEIMGGEAIESEGYTDGKKKWQLVVRNLQSLSAEEFESQLAEKMNEEDWLTVSTEANPSPDTEEGGGEEEVPMDDEELPADDEEIPVPGDDEEEPPVEEEGLKLKEASPVTQAVQVKIGPGKWVRVRGINPTTSGYTVLPQGEMKPIAVTKFTAGKFQFRTVPDGKVIDVAAAREVLNPQIKKEEVVVDEAATAASKKKKVLSTLSSLVTYKLSEEDLADFSMYFHTPSTLVVGERGALTPEAVFSNGKKNLASTGCSDVKELAAILETMGVKTKSKPKPYKPSAPLYDSAKPTSRGKDTGKAKWDGVRANHEGASIDDNPHPKGSPEADAWETGWIQADEGSDEEQY